MIEYRTSTISRLAQTLLYLSVCSVSHCKAFHARYHHETESYLTLAPTSGK